MPYFVNRERNGIHSVYNAQTDMSNQNTPRPCNILKQTHQISPYIDYCRFSILTLKSGGLYDTPRVPFGSGIWPSISGKNRNL